MARKPPEKPTLPQTEIKFAFVKETVTLSLDQIAAIRIVPPALLASKTFLQIVASIREDGIIEPPVVYADNDTPGKYILLDGHLRIAALKELGKTEVTCLVSTDDEAFTFNKHADRLSPVQEHKMILNAIKRGVPEERLARALNCDVASIARRRTMLTGVCKEVIHLLKDKMVAVGVFSILKRMKPLRQIEAVTLMNSANIYSESYANATLAGTPKSQLVAPDKPKKIKGISDEDMARMESESERLQEEYVQIEETFNRDKMNLVLAKGYVSALLGNARIVGYLARHRSDILAEFQKIAEIAPLKKKAA